MYTFTTTNHIPTKIKSRQYNDTSYTSDLQYDSTELLQLLTNTPSEEESDRSYSVRETVRQSAVVSHVLWQ
jgi:hypothetical protein